MSLLDIFEVFSKSIACGEDFKESLKKFLFLLFSPILVSDVIVLLNLPMDLKAYSPLSALVDAWLNILHLFYYEDYEQVSGFKPEKGWVVIDIGAYLGFYTLRAASLVGSQGLVISIEPLSENFRYLSANTKINKFSNIRLVKACVSSSRSEKTLYIPRSSINASILKAYADTMGGVKRVEKVKSITLTDIIRKVEKIDLLKIDVEGAELEVLGGSKNVLDPRKVKRIIVETHVDIVKPLEVTYLLESLGYNVIEYYTDDAPLQAFIYATEKL